MEPDSITLGGDAPGQVARRLVLATRPKFFTASVLPVVLGSVFGIAVAGSFDTVSFVLALFATIFVHAGTNVLNDVYDDLTGNDGPNEARIYPYTGGSRFIQNGVMDAQQMARWGVALLICGVASGMALAYLKGPMIIGFGLVGVALGVLYSAPPFRLSARGLGELAVAVGFGVLPVVGACWLQTGTLSVEAAWLSLPVSLWIANVLLINEVPDADADAASGGRTLVVRLSAKNASRLYLAGQAAASLSALYLASSGLFALWGAAIPLLTIMLAKTAAKAMTTPGDREQLQQGIEATLGIHMLGTLSLIAAIAVGIWL